MKCYLHILRLNAYFRHLLMIITIDKKLFFESRTSHQIINTLFDNQKG